MESLDLKEELIDLKLKKLAILEKERKYRDELPHLYGNKKYPWQQEFCDAKFTHRKRFICAANQIGKVQPNDEIILTSNGYKKNGDIKVGDYVVGSNGELTKVISVFPHKDWDFYKVTFSDGAYTYCGLEHLWKLSDGQVVSTEEIKDKIHYGFSIDYCKPVNFENINKSLNRALAYYMSGNYNYQSKLKVFRVPKDVLLGSTTVRLGFLRGVMDKEGIAVPSKGVGKLVFSKNNISAIDDFIKLVTSLGGRARQRDNILFITLFNNSMFKYIKHRNKMTNNRHNKPIDKRSFVSIEFAYKGDGQCIHVDNEDETYLTSKFNIVTHNSSIQIRDTVDVATNPSIWEDIWPILKKNTSAVPYGWYLYPNQDTVMAEFETKWVTEILPRGSMENHPVYGWKPAIVAKVLKRIDFNSGFKLYFKTYNQNVSDLQSGTVWLIACFTKGNTVYCKDGIKDISKVRIGDYVLTRHGFDEVVNTSCINRPVITRTTNTGKSTTGTFDHPFIIDDKVIKFGKLTEADYLGIVPLWRYLCIYKQTLKLCYLKEIFTEGIARLLRGRKGTIFLGQTEKHCTLQFGKVQMVNGQMGMLSIIKILIRLGMTFQIWSYYLGQNILEFINLKNGKNSKKKNLFVINVVKLLKLDRVKHNVKDFVAKNVEGLLKLLSVNIAEKKKKLDMMQSENFAQDHVQTNQEVYNLTIKNNHEYYINGLLCHNCDEELRELLLPELEARLFATGGIMSMVFTATLGQDIWRRTIECIGKQDEQFPTAWKRQVSMYDCLKYNDGSETPWTLQKINIAKQSCKNEHEVARRIFGKFVLDTGLIYSGFKRIRNFAPYPVNKKGVRFMGVPRGWDLYSAVDYGSGGDGGHPSAIVFLAVNKTFTKIRAIKVKRFDNYGDMTAGDLYKEYRKMRKELGRIPVIQVYDSAAKDFGTIALRSKDFFTKSKKGLEEGALALNTALKTGILVIYDDDEKEGDKLCNELESLTVGYNKNMVRDDLTDALKYCLTSIPVDWEQILVTGKPTGQKQECIDTGRRLDGRFISKKDEEENEKHYQEEFDYWNSQLEYY